MDTRLEQRIRDARTRIRVEDLIARDYELKPIGREFQGVVHDSLRVNPDKQHWFWHSKGMQGDSIDWLTLIHQLSFYDALDELTGRLPASAPIMQTLAQRETARKDPLTPALVDRYHGDLLRQTNALIKLCHDRCMTIDQISEHRIGYKADHWGLGASCVIPVIRGDEVLTIRHRLMQAPADGGNRYRPERTGDRAQLYGWDYVSDGVAIVEGEFKAMTLINHGVPACAIMGIGSFCESFDEEFARRAKWAVVAMDDGIDPRLLSWCKRLRDRGVDLRYAQMPGKPDDLINAGERNTVFSALANAVRLKI